MGVVTEKNSHPELTSLLDSMQAFSNAYLQRDNADKVFFYELMKDINTLQTLLAALNKNEEVTSDLIEFRKRLGTLVESHHKEFDEKLYRQLSHYYSQDIKQKPLSSIEDKIKEIEKSKLYIPPTKTPMVHEFEAKFEEVLKFLKSNEHEYHDKSKFIEKALPGLKNYIDKMKSSTEVVLTSIQVNEIRGIIILFEELEALYSKEVEIELVQEANYKKDLAELPTGSLQWLKKLNSLTQWYIDHAKYEAAEATINHALRKVEKSTEKEFNPPKAKAWELYAFCQLKKNEYTGAKKAYKKAALLLKDLPMYAEYVTALNENAKKAEAQEDSIILAHDKDIENLKRMQLILQKSGDMHLAHIASKEINDLYNQLIDAQVTPFAKTNLINEFQERWHKYADRRGDESFTKPEWYTPEMEQIIATDLIDNLRMIRESFAARNRLRSPIVMIEAKEKAAEEAKIRAAKETKARRARMRAHEEAEKKRLQEEADAKIYAIANKAKLAAEQARADEEALIQHRMREQELVAIRQNIMRSMKEAEEETKLKEAIELFDGLETQEHSGTDLTLFAKSLIRLGVLLRDQGKFYPSEEYFIRAINVYDNLLKKPDYNNVATVSMKVEAISELARTYYIQRKYFDAEQKFDAALADLEKMRKLPNLDESFKALFEELQIQNKARALLMAKMVSAEEVSGIKEMLNTDNMIETLYHAPALRQKCNEEEMKLVHHTLDLDKNLDEKNARVQQWHKIMVTMERPIFQKVILLREYLKGRITGLEIADKNTLKVYADDLLNLAFVEVLLNASNKLSNELQPLISEIKAIRNELCMGQDNLLTALDLPLEQKIVYLQYEKYLAEKENRPVDNLDLLLKNYLNQYMKSPAGKEKTKSKRRWLGRVLSVLRKKKKSTDYFRR